MFSQYCVIPVFKVIRLSMKATINAKYFPVYYTAMKTLKELIFGFIICYNFFNSTKIREIVFNCIKKCYNKTAKALLLFHILILQNLYFGGNTKRFPRHMHLCSIPVKQCSRPSSVTESCCVWSNETHLASFTIHAHHTLQNFIQIIMLLEVDSDICRAV